MSILPSLHQKYTTFIRPRKLDPDDAPLRLVIEHGRRQFPVVLKVKENDHGDKISVRHLAEMVYCETGIHPQDQKYYWKGLTWQDPDMGPWSPCLKTLGVRNGDKIQLVSFHAPFPDYVDIEALKCVDMEMKATLKQIGLTVHKIQGIDLGYTGGSQLMALSKVRKEFEEIKMKLQKDIEDLNRLHFHHLNCMSQARRRELVDEAQRQIDKCTHFSTLIVHKLAQSHYLSNSGTLFDREIQGKRSKPKGKSDFLPPCPRPGPNARSCRQ